MTIDYNKFIHPEDRAALESLKAIPGIDLVLKKYMELVDEKMMRGVLEGNAIHLSPTQLPEYYNLLPEICEDLGIPVPELFLEMNPLPNAYTFGDTNPFIVINSGLIEMLTTDELKAVIAHECGHILCRHVLYSSVARCLVNFGFNFFLPNIAWEPVIAGLMYWSRRSEYSSDRVAAYVMDNSDIVVKTMIRLSGGPPNITDNINIQEYMAQANNYMTLTNSSVFNKVMQGLAVYKMDHPLSAVRSYEIRKWFDEAKKDLPEKANAHKTLSW